MTGPSIVSGSEQKRLSDGTIEGYISSGLTTLPEPSIHSTGEWRGTRHGENAAYFMIWSVFFDHVQD